VRARATLILLSFFAALATSGLPSVDAAAAAAAIDRAPTAVGGFDQTPAVASHSTLSVARAANARNGLWKAALPALAVALEAPPLTTLSTRAPEAAAAPIAPPSAPRSCRGPPRA